MQFREIEAFSSTIFTSKFMRLGIITLNHLINITAYLNFSKFHCVVVIIITIFVLEIVQENNNLVNMKL